MKFLLFIVFFFIICLHLACDRRDTFDDVQPRLDDDPQESILQPIVITEQVRYDSDDPAIWVNSKNPKESLIIGTDKNQKGALYVFDLNGKIIEDKVVRGLARPNNVDIEYQFNLNGQPIDIAVVSERYTNQLRIFKLPDMLPIDNGGIPVFEGETEEGYRDLMGIALYKNPVTKKVYAILSRLNGPSDGTYLWQYLLEDDGKGAISATVVRKFGNFSDKKVIESIAVDDDLGYVYYSDEKVGVRKYYADPEKGNEELALFATEGFAEDHEGISIYKTNDKTGYILVSDQQNNQFHIFTREGAEDAPHQHELVKIVQVEAIESDGSEVTSIRLNDHFSKGLFVAMSNNKTFHYYSWEDIAGNDL